MTTVLAGCTESVVVEDSGDEWVRFDNRASIMYQVFTAGDVLTIEWSSSETEVDIYYKVDGGGWNVISQGERSGSDGSGSYLWTVPNEPSDQGVEIKIHAADAPWTSSGLFSIVLDTNGFKDLRTTEDYQNALDFLLSSCSSGFVDFTYSSMVVEFSGPWDGAEYMINVPDHSDEVENFHTLMDEKTNLTKNDQYDSWEVDYYTDDTSIGANDMDVIFREVFDLEEVGIDAMFFDC
jgi:hypothetical protein